MLSSADQAKICDFAACGWGGYGKSKSCSDGTTVKGPKSAPDCQAQIAAYAPKPSCASVTVADYEACQKKINATPCDALKILLGDPACTSFSACATH
jgi:hypothetical protein